MILDLFAGPGGWDEGLRLLGRDDVLGIEVDKYTVETRLAAGHATLQADVKDLDPMDFQGWEGLIASPPCQTFSAAGLQRGLDDLRGQLVYEVMRFAYGVQPQWIACEEVKEVLPIWRSFSYELRKIGYFSWSGLLNAADFGVPQSRTRAFLLAAKHPFSLPIPTHSKDGGASLFGELQPWVTMAKALGLEDSELLQGQEWMLQRPATTIVRSFRPEVVAAPGWRSAGDGPRQNTPGSYVATPEEMCRLQGVDPCYPFAGPKTKRLSLIGAFLPPQWAAAVLRAVISPAEVCANCGNDLPALGMTWCAQCLEST